MVSTRVVVTLGAFIVFLSWGMVWLQSTTEATIGFTSFSIFTAVGSAVGTCHCPPSTDTPSGIVMLALLPYLIPPGSLSPGLILLPISSLVSFASFFRLKLALWGGLMTVADGALWLVATSLLPSEVGVNSSLGPYAITIGGIILIASSALTRLDRLDPSDDLRWD